MKRIWLWGGMGVLVLVLVSALTVGLIAKFTAESVANESTPSIKLYIDKVISAAEASEDPKVITASLDSIDSPEFKNIPFGDISSNYRAARQFHQDAVAKTDEFKKKIDGYAQALTFYSDYEKINSQLNSLQPTNTSSNGRVDDRAYLDTHYSLLQKMNALIGKTVVASDYSNEFVELGRVYGTMERTTEGIITALKQENDLGFSNLYQQYEMAKAQVPRVDTSLNEYAKSVPEKVRAAVDKLKVYRGNL